MWALDNPNLTQSGSLIFLKTLQQNVRAHEETGIQGKGKADILGPLLPGGSFLSLTFDANKLSRGEKKQLFFLICFPFEPLRVFPKGSIFSLILLLLLMAFKGLWGNRCISNEWK